MGEQIAGYLQTLPAFLLYFLAATIISVLFVALYIRTTPHREIALIRDGNVAAAVKLGGAFIGFVIAEASVIIGSLDLADMILWGLVALAVQILTYQGVRLIIPDLSDAIIEDRVSVGLFAGAVAIGIGILNAACLSY